MIKAIKLCTNAIRKCMDIVWDYVQECKEKKRIAEEARTEAARIAAEEARADAERIVARIAERARAIETIIAAEKARAEAARIAAEEARAEAARIAAEKARIAEEARATAARIAAEKARAEAERIEKLQKTAAAASDDNPFKFASVPLGFSLKKQRSLLRHSAEKAKRRFHPLYEEVKALVQNDGDPLDITPINTTAPRHGSF